MVDKEAREQLTPSQRGDKVLRVRRRRPRRRLRFTPDVPGVFRFQADSYRNAFYTISPCSYRSPVPVLLGYLSCRAGREWTDRLLW